MGPTEVADAASPRPIRPRGAWTRAVRPDRTITRTKPGRVCRRRRLDGALAELPPGAGRRHAARPARPERAARLAEHHAGVEDGWLPAQEAADDQGFTTAPCGPWC